MKRFWSPRKRTALAGVVVLCFAVSVIGGCDDNTDEVSLRLDYFSDVPLASAPTQALTLIRAAAVPEFDQDVEVQLYLTSTPEQIRDISFEVTYDRNIVLYRDFMKGDYFEAGLADPNIVIYDVIPFTAFETVDDEEVEVNGVRASIRWPDTALAGTGVDGNGTILFMNFDVQNEGTSGIRFRDNELKNPQGGPVTGMAWYAGLFNAFFS